MIVFYSLQTPYRNTVTRNTVTVQYAVSYIPYDTDRSTRKS